MAQETVVLVTNVSDKYLTAEDAINNNFDEVYAGITSGAPLNQSSGVLTGGVLSIGTGGAGVATTFSITAGTGQIVDNTVNPTTVTAVSWTAQINVAVTNILTNLVTFVAIDSGGNVIQSTTDFTPVQMREYIVIGVVVHSNQTTVNAINQAQIVAYNQGNQLTDLMYSIGLFNVSGNIFSANGANLKINKSAGSIFRRGANYTTLTDNPHLVTTGALTQAPLRMQNQTGAGSASTTDIDVANYDLAGVTTAISPATRFSVLRIYLFQSNLIAVQRGQATYQSLAEAKASIQTETFVTNSILAANGLLRGFLCVRANATDLSNPTQAFFIDAGKFGSSSGVGGLSVSTLQNAYDNSSTPEILTDSTRGAISVKRGSAADTDAVIEVLNGAGSTVATITGEGNVTVTDEAYGVGWDGSTEVPTKNALYDKIETLGGASAFTDLTDVPASYAGQALKVARVNAGETALEFAVIAGTGDVVKVGTPVNNQVGVWTGDGTIEGDAALTFDTATDKLTVDGRVHTTTVEAHTSAGLLIEANGGADVALFGAGGGQNATFYDGVKLDASTASRILSTDASKNITALNTATYPDLTELSYVKGVTSAIQTQLNAKPDDFLELSDTPNSYAGEGLKLVRVNATPNALEFVTANSTLVGLGNVVNADTTTMANITGTKAQFDTAVTDGNILFVGDITQYTDELAQDAVGAMVDTTLVYNDLAPSLSRAALTGAITASAGSNATLLGSFTTAQLNTALSDNDIATGGGTATGTNTGDQTSIVGISGTKAQFDTACSDGNFLYVGDQPSLSYASAFATATTSISAATYADITGCSVTLAAGTWLIIGHVVVGAVNAITQGFVAITDSANTVIAASALSRPASGTANLASPFAVSWQGIVTPAGSTTYKLRAARGLTTHTATYTVYDGTGYNTVNHATDNSDKGTSIIAIRIA